MRLKRSLAARVPRLRLSRPPVSRVNRPWLAIWPPWLLICAARLISSGPPLASLPLVLVRVASRSRVVAVPPLMLPALLSRFCVVRFRAAPLSITPPWALFSKPPTVSVCPAALESTPLLLLSSSPALTVSAFWLTSAPPALLSRLAVSVALRSPYRLDKVPPLRLSRFAPLTVRPCQPDIRPFWLIRFSALSTSRLLLISLPLLLFNVRPLRFRVCALESSPPWLLRSRRWLMERLPAVVIRPPALFRSPVAVPKSRAIALPSSEPFWLSSAALLSVSVLLALSRPWSRLIRRPATLSSVSPRLVRVPPLLSRSVAWASTEAAAIRPLTLARAWPMRRVSAALLSSLPLLLSRLSAVSVNAWLLEISPPWLCTFLRLLSINSGALIRPFWLLNSPRCRSSVSASALVIWPPCWLLRSAVPRDRAWRVLRVPFWLLSTLAALSIRLPSVTSRPPRLSTAPSALRVSGPALESVPPPLASVRAVMLSSPSLLIKPWLRLSSWSTFKPAPAPAISSPPSLLSSCVAVTCTPTRLDSSPLRLSMLATLTCTPPTPATKPFWRLSRLLPATLTVPWLVTSPAWLLRLPTLRLSALPAVIRPATLSRVATVSVAVSRLESSPPWLFTSPTTAVSGALLVTNPPWVFCRRSAVMARPPLLRMRPLFWLSTVAAVIWVCCLAPSVPPWLFNAWASTLNARLAITLAPVLVTALPRRLTSPVALRVLSALTPASMMSPLVSVPPLDSAMRSRAARLWRLVRSPWVFTLRAVPAYTGPLASRLAALMLTAPLAAVCAMLKCPLASSWISPPLAANVPSSFTPTPASVPTSLIAPAYMPPKALESMASSGLALPSSARAVAFRLLASTSLRPATTASSRALICALILAVRVMISKRSTLLAFRPSPSMVTAPPSTW
ncbi:hypothetical protein ALP97_05244 [Pseudomonas salomonii]|uniref:Uncharacterized protein n=1 Tax=Pseudomonas salomonii TaxID=191391 RepID=A0A3M4PYG4_9PSED|nr:hypothetical protein ALP97_05244 [Pseudomonas salomonii]